MKVRLIAALLVDESGHQAIDEARSRHSELRAAGDRVGEQVWAQVVTIIEELLNPADNRVATLH